MRLPNADNLIVEREKIVGYLLDITHPRGVSKARFFQEFGFRLEHWTVLAEALRQHGRQWGITRTTETGFGPRYEVEGEIQAADGRRPRLPSVWQFDCGQIAPRLITAYPLER